jgi:signal transduction histidine kinase
VEEAREELRQKTGDRGRVKKSPFEGGAVVPTAVGTEAGDVSGISDILEILDDIETNLCKIHEHGSRADGIVKSMLQHSRGGSGNMEPTHLNHLIEEYVNLAFHGMRAGKNPVTVDIELDLDEQVGEIPLVSEDFSRVILNLCNNAFDAMREKASSFAKASEGKKVKSALNDSDSRVSEKAKELPSPRGRGVGGEGDYKPKLTVRTKSNDGNILIEVEDNGSGIPDEIREKILQPFFTTKKGSQGTGLGLSITHDIIKAHGGAIDIKSTSDAGTTFCITLTGYGDQGGNNENNLSA